jgi:hypothetical protein
MRESCPLHTVEPWLLGLPNLHGETIGPAREAPMTTPASRPAERARTILAGALTADLVGADGLRAQWPMERLTLGRGPDPGAWTPDRRCLVDVADAAPVAGRERIRGRLRVFGFDVAACAGPALHLDVERAVLAEGGRSVELTVDDLLDAAPDPLRWCEASVLTHLTSAHEDVLLLLVRLLDPADLQGAVRVWPLRLDRHGIELRVEYATGHRDRALDFDSAVGSADELTAAMTRLIARARTVAAMRCARARAAPARTPVDAVIRAAAAARRLCSPYDGHGPVDRDPS